MTWRQDGQEQNDKRLFFYFSDEQKPKWAGYIVRLPACLSLPAHPAEACSIKLLEKEKNGRYFLPGGSSAGHRYVLQVLFCEKITKL